MSFPDNLKYSKEHEWVMVEDDIALVGITDYAQSELGDVVYVELPDVGEKITKDDPFGSVESVKAVSDLFAPVSGTVIEVNDSLPDSPELVNEDCYGDGWMVKVQMSDKEELKDLLGHEDYGEYVEREKEEDDDDEEEG
ncbi:MAG: glycine cleavage system protein GcvH [Deltaproteobacteria bacterium]|nr:glycine cleavage system protein GcvH [Deltaproteobacteria bacterium]